MVLYSLPQQRREELAATLFSANNNRTVIPSLGQMTVNDAIDIQNKLAAQFYETGVKRTGLKLGFTSTEIMYLLGTANISVGPLFDTRGWACGDTVDFAPFLDPLIETELVLRMGKDIKPEEEWTVSDVMRELRSAVTGVAVGFDIIDCHFGWEPMACTDAIAEVLCSAAYVVGPWQTDNLFDLGDLKVELTSNGELIEESNTNEILGNPQEIFPELAMAMLRYGLEINEGDVIFSGAVSRGTPFVPGHKFVATVEGIGSCTVTAGETDRVYVPHIDCEPPMVSCEDLEEMLEPCEESPAEPTSGA